MTDQNQQVDSADARQASMSRVETSETILAKIASAQAATKPSEASADDKQETQGQEVAPVKKTAQERISELANKRREAEAEAEQAKRENAELKARLKALETAAPQIEQSNKPNRTQFASDDEYIEALTDWKAQDAIAKREKQQMEARQTAEFAQIEASFEGSIKSAQSRYEDFNEVVGNATVVIPAHVAMAIKESPLGGDLTYYLAVHQSEAEKLNSMRPIQAIKYLSELEKDLSIDEPAIQTKTPVKTPEKTRAPEPISQVRGAPVTPPGSAKSFAEHRAKRLAEQRR